MKRTSEHGPSSVIGGRSYHSSVWIIMRNILDPNTADRKTLGSPVPVKFIDAARVVLSDDVDRFHRLLLGEISVRVNGAKIPRDKFEELLVCDGDVVLLCPEVRNPLAIFAGIFLVFTIGFSIYQYIQMRKQLKKIKDIMKDDVEGESLSQAYAFNVKENIVADDYPIAVLYGKCRCGGVILNRRLFSSTKGDRERMWLLLGIGYGRMKSVAPNGASDIFLGNSTLAEYSDYNYYTARGYNVQKYYDDDEEKYYSVGESKQNSPLFRDMLCQQNFINQELINTLSFYLSYNYTSNRASVIGDGAFSYSFSSGAGTVSSDPPKMGYYGNPVLKLSGSSDYVRYGDHDYVCSVLQPRTDPFTLEFWYYRPSSSFPTSDTNYVLISHAPYDGWGTDGQRRWMVELLHFSSDYKFKIRFACVKRDDDEDVVVAWCETHKLDADLLCQTATWPESDGVHIAVVRDGDRLAIYVNGKDETNENADDPFFPDGSDTSIHVSDPDGSGDWDNNDRFGFGKIASYGNSAPSDSYFADFKFYLGVCKYKEAEYNVNDIVTDDADQYIDVHMNGYANELEWEIAFEEGLYSMNNDNETEKETVKFQWDFYCTGGDSSGETIRMCSFGTNASGSDCGQNIQEASGQSQGVVVRTYSLPFFAIQLSDIDGPFRFGDKVECHVWTQFPGGGGSIAAKRGTGIIVGCAYVGGGSYKFYLARTGDDLCCGADSEDAFPPGGKTSFPSGSTVYRSDDWSIKGTLDSDGKWESNTGYLRIRRRTPARGNVFATNRSTFRSVNEIRYARKTPTQNMKTCQFFPLGSTSGPGLRYQNVALLGLDITAQSGLSSSIPKVNVIAERYERDEDAYVPDHLTYWDGSTYQTMTSSSKGYNLYQNPAWVAFDILTDGWVDSNGQRHGMGYGAGIDPKRVDYDSFNSWAAYCNEDIDGTKRCQINIVFDMKDKTVWDALEIVATVGRARIITVGYKYYAVVDKPASESSPGSHPAVQLFSSANILEGSLKVSFIEADNKPNRVVVEFMNEDNFYLKDSVSAEADDWDTTTEPPNEDKVFVPGITNSDQAKREATLRLQLARALRQRIEFMADVDAIACQVGDVIAVQHESNRFTFGGKLTAVDAVNKTVTLDRKITLDSSVYGDSNCVIYARRSGTDVIAKTTITGPFDTETEGPFNLSDSLGASVGDIYAIGRATEDTMLYRVEEIEVDGDGRVKIVATNYESDPYYHDDWGSGSTPI